MIQMASASYPRPLRRRPVELTPRPPRCPICGTDLENTTNCPGNCLTRTEEKP